MTEVADNTLVDGRYRIVERIGSGGMADVYRAQDTHLGREVALKVLHRRFAQDQEFVERFRREAKSAAGLQHPNVVGVYDRGEHDGTYYIAMEHLPGRTLKEILAGSAPLPEEQVIDLGLQILAAAAFAHRHGVIHRDFKPHNVIVDEQGQAKVTDFGIARAGASEMTETGSIMGTAQYLSPEQAQGHAVTPASDLYSIGVMLYELLAGRLPFEGDSAVSVALKHLSEPPPPISSFRPDVSPALEAVVMAALAKDPAQRWQSADDFAGALVAVRDQIVAGDGGVQSTAVFAPVPLPEAADQPAAGEHKRRWPWFTLGLLTLLLAALLAFLALSGLLATEQVEVPRVVGKQLLQARAALEQRGFEVQESRVQSAQPLDQVIDQDPNASTEADKGSTVTLEVSTGPGTVRVPPVANLSEKQAVRALNREGLQVIVDLHSSETVREGVSIRTVPAEGEDVEKGTRVRLLVSSGPEQVAVPDVTGLSSESAQQQLRDAGLEPAVREDASEDVDEGDVISQSPAAGTSIKKNDTVTLTVSTGPERVRVPDVTGLSTRLATSQLRQAGLKAVPRERTVTDMAQDGLVLEQRPTGGELGRGDSVVLIVGKLAPPPDQTPGTVTPEQPSGDPGTTP
jgi:serine/threonine-protein kinase